MGTINLNKFMCIDKIVSINSFNSLVRYYATYIYAIKLINKTFKIKMRIDNRKSVLVFIKLQINCVWLI